MTEILDQPWAASPDAFNNKVADETVLLHIKRNTYYGMNALGTRIWQGILDSSNLRDICRDIAGEHDMPVAEVEADARAYLEDLKANEIIIAR